MSLFLYLINARSQNTPPGSDNSPLHTIDNANLSATDALGRTLPDYASTGESKPGRYVGLFYWLWHGPLRCRSNEPDSFNVSSILARDPYRTEWAFQDYYWNQPENGYYRSDDPWVMQRHLLLMAEAGIDFLFLDLTNDAVYEPEITQLCGMIRSLRRQGINAPYLVPFLNADFAGKIGILYDQFYKSGKYDDLWFRWQGKPLLLSPIPDSTQITDRSRLKAIHSCFTWRPTWALFPVDSASKGKWRFMDLNPQNAALGPNGKPEQYVVSKSMGAPLWNYKINGSSSGLNHVPVYDKFWLTPETGKGYFFNEQFNRADSVQAPILLITGWNEWKAGAWPTGKDLAAAPDFKFEDRKMNLGDMYFVDEFNNEFNRDLEPMKGGYTDNFYYQLVARVRHYKGMQKPQSASALQIIGIDGRFGEWSGVTPVYKDAQGDILHRDHEGVRPGIRYIDSTGRNDILESRTARDRSNIYFYVKTAAPLSSSKDNNWMLLFIDADHDKKTGWEGYDYVVNATVIDDHTTTLKKWSNGHWKTIARIPYKVAGNEMELAIPAQKLHIDTAAPDFNFHWMDNMQQWNDITEFFLHGDSAPERRFDYHYQTRFNEKP